MALVVRSPPANAGDAGLIPGSGRPSGERNGNPLQYSCLKNPMDGSLVGYSLWGCKRVGQNLATKQQQQQAPLELKFLSTFHPSATDETVWLQQELVPGAL